MVSKRAIGQSHNSVAWRPQVSKIITPEAYRNFFISQLKINLSQYRLDRETLQLAAIDRVGDGSKRIVAAGVWQRQVQHQRQGWLARFGRMAAPVLYVAGLATSGIVKWSEPVGSAGRSRGCDPDIVEVPIAKPEQRRAIKREVGTRLRKGLCTIWHAQGGSPSQQVFEGLGSPEVCRRGGDCRDKPLVCGRPWLGHRVGIADGQTQFLAGKRAGGQNCDRALEHRVAIRVHILRR